MNTVLLIVFILLVAALALAFVRFARGPSLPDRVIALDLIAMTIAGMIAATAVAMRQPALLDALVVLAIVVFFGGVVFARYLERRGTDDD